MATKKATKTVYTGIPYGAEEAELSLPVALVQAAQALDIAAEKAVECSDLEVLVQVASLWMNMAQSILASATNDDETEPIEPGQTIGFERPAKEMKIDNQE